MDTANTLTGLPQRFDRLHQIHNHTVLASRLEVVKGDEDVDPSVCKIVACATLLSSFARSSNLSMYMVDPKGPST